MKNKFKWSVFFICVCLASCQKPKEAHHISIQNWTTNNGVRVYFVPLNDLPIVNLHIAFKAGSAYDNDQWGLAAMTNSLLNDGAGNLNADQIAEGFENVGAHYSTDVGRDMAVVSLRSLAGREYLKPALETLSTVLVDPTFPQKAFTRVQKQFLTSIKAEKQSPSALASNAFYKTLYGKHPYAHSVTGSKETVTQLNTDNVKQFYEKYYVASNAVIVLAGDLKKREAKRIANQLTEQLPTGETANLIQKVKALPREEHTIDFPSSQTTVTMGQVAIKKNDPDFFPLFVGNHILGGGAMVSKLNDAIREKRGLSYAVYSYFSTLAKPGPFVLKLQTKNEQTEEAITVAKETLQNFLATPPSEHDLSQAKKNITGSFPTKLDSTKSIANIVLSMAFYELPLDYLDTYQEKVNAVTPTQIKDAFAKHIHLDDMSIIRVGKQNLHDKKV